MRQVLYVFFGYHVYIHFLRTNRLTTGSFYAIIVKEILTESEYIYMERFFTNQISDEVYQSLISNILTSEIHPGDKITEAFIAQKFNISRTPIREALRDLANEGIIDISPNKAAKVAEYDSKRIRDVGLTRTALDRLAVSLAIYYGSRVDYKELRGYAEACYDAAMQHDEAARIKADIEFHWFLARISKNQELIDMEKTLLIKLEFLQAANRVRAEDPKDQLDSHLAVINALERGDVEAGLKAITTPNIRVYGLDDLADNIFY